MNIYLYTFNTYTFELLRICLEHKYDIKDEVITKFCLRQWRKIFRDIIKYRHTPLIFLIFYFLTIFFNIFFLIIIFIYIFKIFITFLLILKNVIFMLLFNNIKS